MKRAVFTIFLAVAVLLLISAHEGPLLRNTDTYSAPKLFFGDGDSAISLDDMRGKYVLLTFWSSGDAKSRLSNIMYSSLASRNTGLEHIGVNFDSSPSMFKEILKRDNLAGSPLQVRVDGISADRLISRYGLKNGFQSFLVDPAGKVVARNPSLDMISDSIAAL
ncbi:MAG: thioredoxin family protein [Muribaculaceae bacterium]|nr:thioredoxin family protein [Muribaculaceae bacterium]